MNNLDHLYREIIMEHYKNPRNKGLINDDHYHKNRIKNPSCGDDITIQVLIEDGFVKDVKQVATGCSISVASASVLSEIMIGKSVEEAKKIVDTYINMVTNKEFDESVDLEEAAVFSGVKKFPARIKCASIAWIAFKDSLE
ncbi:MAG: Fe-S cluster assembly sulfur transfer protein SufU [Candidatus Izemoplasmatales bacterium]|uniref:SUF system NifU family Fe-S cluster assembly protein n=1 Tax=Hujiaoplasma nucleasis TaxID=2725268 RepID=A0A7L6N3E8_9MOLU|nr:SUF system NifU family Fe-S cluster assembly protein [Hujiaoplasma nucleasis]QLY40071.1 SUF system NifU family Fe-S cluster assembly protein [Hujiaoplasma nucleasis]